MKKFDFISGAPKTFIFQQDSNKTNLGGILTVLFIIAMFIIIYSYIYEYFANDKYNVSYYYDEVYYKDEEIDEIYNNIDLYPELTYTVKLKGSNKSLLNNLVVVDNDKIINPGEKRTTRVSDLYFEIYSRCKNKTDCKISDGTDNLNLFSLELNYDGFFCDHQNPKTPIKRDEDYEEFLFTVEDRIDFYLFDWKIIKYEEESSFVGMFRKTKETYGGEFSETEKYSIPSEGMDKINVTNNQTNETYYFQLAAVIRFNDDNFGYYDHYSRDRISIFDAIANICALITTLYGVVTFIFCGFYSNSFDNYKIIEKIISRSAYLNIKSLKDEPPKEQIKLKEQIESDKGETLLEVKEDSDDKKMLDDDINKEKDNISKPLFRIPKFHFYDFLYNNVYGDCCKPSTTQGIISSCNDLISKYYSIDAVIYNQLRLENLFKDYKWNNPQLNSITNNDLILQIKTLSGNLNGS